MSKEMDLLDEYKEFCKKHDSDIEYLYRKINDFKAGDYVERMICFLFEKVIELNEANKELLKYKKVNLKDFIKSNEEKNERFKNIEMD